MSININSTAFQMALAAANENNYIPYESFEQVDFLPDGGTNEHARWYDNAEMRKHRKEFLSDDFNPMDALLRAEREEQLAKCMANLSDEARQIIKILTTAPQEMADILTTPKGRATQDRAIKSRLLDKLAKQWNDRRHAKKVIREIENLVALF